MEMTLEQMDHFLRHIKMHATNLKKGTFNKEKEYLMKLQCAQYLALEISHDMIHVMRTKMFKGYEDADFSFYVHLPEDIERHEFRTFDNQSFRVGCKLKSTLDMGMIPEKYILLEKGEAETQMEVLGNAIQDAGVLIKMLEEYFKE